MAAQSLKTVYLKIAAMIHPDREQDESKKEGKNRVISTRPVRRMNSRIYFICCKLQLQLEQNKGVGAKELSAGASEVL